MTQTTAADNTPTQLFSNSRKQHNKIIVIQQAKITNNPISSLVDPRPNHQRRRSSHALVVIPITPITPISYLTCSRRIARMLNKQIATYNSLHSLSSSTLPFRSFPCTCAHPAPLNQLRFRSFIPSCVSSHSRFGKQPPPLPDLSPQRVL